jgi:hypothetical protein
LKTKVWEVVVALKKMEYDKYKDLGGIGGSNTNEGYGFPHVQRDGSDVGMAYKHITHEREHVKYQWLKAKVRVYDSILEVVRMKVIKKVLESEIA